MRAGETGYLGVVDAVGLPIEVVNFGDLEISWDRRILQPRPWTTAHSYWAVALATRSPDGPLLELCCGAGQIGLLAAALSGRSLVQVDQDPVAAGYARRNAVAAGIRSDVRTAPMTGALAPGERFALILLDAPLVASSRLEDHPDDPTGAIDGGIGGTDQLVLGLGVALRHLDPRGHLVAQAAAPEQVELVQSLVSGLGGGDDAWAVLEVRDYGPEGFLLDIGRRTPMRQSGLE